MNFDARTLVWLVLLLPSITFHEFMHGYAAYRLGDPTAKNAGRLTLNPLKHVDPFGTVLLPLILFATGGPIFGYAKPVPYNPRYFKNLRQGDFIVGIAGPASNLALALLGAAIAWVGVVGGQATASPTLIDAGFLVGYTLAQTNLVLMFFNLLPIPPLDGSSIVPLVLPDRAMPTWYRIQQYSFPILFVALFVLPQVLRIDPIGAYFDYTVLPLLNLLFAWA